MTTTIIFDIETDGLKNPSKIHCISTMSLAGSHAVVSTCYDGHPHLSIPGRYNCGTIEDALWVLQEADTLIGHNIISYDLPVIKKLYPSFKLKPTCKIIDTMLMACIFDADGAISLEDWSIKLGKTSKVANEDWSVLTENMLIRNRSDVLITKEVYDFILTNYGEAFPWSSLELEQKVAAIHQKQVEYGVWFDEEAAISLYNDLCLKMIELERDILKDAPKRCVRYKKKADEDGLVYDIVKPFLKSGDHTTQVTNWFPPEYLPHVRGPCCRIEFKEIELGSSDQVKALLLSLGWKPTTYNFSKKTGLITSPQLTEDSYDSIPPGLGQKIAEYNTIKHRRNYLFNQEDDTKGALNNIRPDGRIPAEGMTCATNTARYRHSGVVCNVPKAKASVKYGKEIRSLFGVTKGSTQLGFDKAQIEARLIAHFSYKYPGGPEMAHRILSGDFHQYNADTWDVSRDTSKGGLYALCFGCGDAKLAKVLGKPEKQGKKLKDAFWKANPAIKRLIDELESSYDNHPGYIYGIDGRRVRVRDKRKLLNTLIQNSAAILFKRWMIKIDELELRDLHQMLAMHDELQFQLDSTDPDRIQEVIQLVENCAKEVGEELNLNVPIAAEGKQGVNWSQCH